MRVIGEARNGEEFLKLLDTCTPDLVFMDIDMPVMDGIKATENAIRIDSSLKIIALTGFADEENYYNMIKAGAMGFILKHSGKEEIENAIHTVINGDSYFSRELLQNIVYKKNIIPNNGYHTKEWHITPREKEILNLICLGNSDNDIAIKLSITPKAANSHRNRLLMKTGSKN
ncbi:MAG: response regulator transcription factor, partial [Bacteroidales bacterium]|nr:response regulator transcription factor [Bacteroidales bacterium]